jgi:hypothetical protein
MILKNYTQFINENFHPIDFDDDELMYDLAKAGFHFDEEGNPSFPEERSYFEININDGLISQGRMYIDLSYMGSSRMDLDISELPLDYLEGLPEKVRNFKAHNNTFRSLEGGPQDVGENYSVYHNKRLTSLDGAPLTAYSFEVVNTGIKDCTGTEQSGLVLLYLANNENLTSLRGLPDSIEETITIRNCRQLETLQYCPESNDDRIIIENCPIKTLYHVRYMDPAKITLNETKVPNVEMQFFFGERYSIEEKDKNYYENLFIFAKKFKPKELGLIQFPEEFINGLSEKDKTLLRSAKGLAKYDL